MPSYRAIIVDDEALLRAHLKTMLAKAWPELEICGEASDGNQALDLALGERPDIAFLDIRMPGKNGLDVAAGLPDGCLAVFVTAYDEYAIEAFEKAAVDYILKPLRQERIVKTVKRLIARLQVKSQSKSALEQTLAQVKQFLAEHQQQKHLEWLRVQDRGGIRLLPVDDVIYFQASDKYTLVITSDCEYLIRTSLKQLAGELDPNKFWQIHRKTIVNVGMIADVDRSLTGRFVVNLIGRSESLTVSRTFSHLFRQM